MKTLTLSLTAEDGTVLDLVTLEVDCDTPLIAYRPLPARDQRRGDESVLTAASYNP